MTGRRRERALLAVASAIAAAAVVAGAMMAAAPQPQTGPRDLAGHHVAFDSGVLPPPDVQQRMRATSRIPDGRLHIPAVGLDVPLGAMDEVDNYVQPPTFTSAYWIRNLGTAPGTPDSGTVFVAMHSLRGGGIGPGNYLYDTATGQSKVRPGQQIYLDGTGYQITGIATVEKAAIGDDSAVWADAPGRLVMITCLELPDGGPSRDNFIVTAVHR